MYPIDYPRKKVCIYCSTNTILQTGFLWWEEAFAEAKAEYKPIFLSIVYS